MDAMSTGMHEPLPLTPASEIPAALGPLAHSHTATDLEGVAQSIFMAVFEEMVRPRITAIETQAIAHRASAVVVRQAITADGLAMERPDAEEAHIRQLYRSWRARNPRRGLSFLTQYLQLLWPGRWECGQLWQDPQQPYPTGVARQQRPGYWLTSRVLVAVDLDDPSGAALGKMRGSLRSVLAARLVILMALLRKFDKEMHWACAFHALSIAGVPKVAPLQTKAVNMELFVDLRVSDGQIVDGGGGVVNLANGGPTISGSRMIGNLDGWVSVDINASRDAYPYSIKITGASVSGDDVGLRNEVVSWGDWTGGGISIFCSASHCFFSGFNTENPSGGWTAGFVPVNEYPNTSDIEFVFNSESSVVVKINGVVFESVNSGIATDNSGWWGSVGFFSTVNSAIGGVGPHFSCTGIQLFGVRGGA